MKIRLVKFYLFLFITTLLTGFFFILPDFLNYPTNGIKGYLYTFGHFGLVCIPLFLLLYLISLNKYIFTLTFPVFTLLGSIIGYYSFRYKATLTPMLVDATFNNDLQTSLDVIPLELIFFLLIYLLLSIYIVYYRAKNILVKYKIIHFIAISVSLLGLFNLNNRIVNTFMQHFPLSVYRSLSEYSKLNSDYAINRINPDSKLSNNSKDSTIVIFVLGETLRADHLSLNGYRRKTTPNLEKRKNLISLSNIYSEYTYTNPSVAHILTRADSTSYIRAKKEKSFIQLFNQCNYQTTWLANQDASKSYYSFMKECDTLIYGHPEKSVYTYSKWLDEDLLPHFNRILKKNSETCQLIILHTIGSHWYYNSHFSEEFIQFKPLAKSKVVAQNTEQEMINSYDNTILYMDYFVNEVIQKNENEKSILIYLSDHGEALGENGQWLHASDNDILHRPASFIWFSDKYLSSHKKAYSNLIKNKDKRYRTDFLYHTILSAGNIPSSVIDENLNIFSK